MASLTLLSPAEESESPTRLEASVWSPVSRGSCSSASPGGLGMSKQRPKQQIRAEPSQGSPEPAAASGCCLPGGHTADVTLVPSASQVTFLRQGLPPRSLFQTQSPADTSKGGYEGKHNASSASVAFTTNPNVFSRERAWEFHSHDLCAADEGTGHLTAHSAPCFVETHGRRSQHQPGVIHVEGPEDVEEGVVSCFTHLSDDVDCTQGLVPINEGGERAPRAGPHVLVQQGQGWSTSRDSLWGSKSEKPRQLRHNQSTIERKSDLNRTQSVSEWEKLQPARGLSLSERGMAQVDHGGPEGQTWQGVETDEDVTLDLLMSRLRLYKVQRQMAAAHCARFAESLQEALVNTGDGAANHGNRRLRRRDSKGQRSHGSFRSRNARTLMPTLSTLQPRCREDANFPRLDVRRNSAPSERILEARLSAKAERGQDEERGYGGDDSSAC